MKRLSLLMIAFTTAIFCHSRPIDACGYGLLDPDVETFCSGDPNQAGQALANLDKRGPKVTKVIKRYRDRAISQKKSHEQYLARLQAADPALKMQPEQIKKEVQRIKTWLDWNNGRMLKIDYLFFRFNGWAHLTQLR